ncbi:MAG: GNAT family N-acetyltransferase [Pyrinomonadaceae bacterium]
MSSNDTSKASTLKFCRIDDSFNTGELARRIKEILIESDSHTARSFSERKWTWQYKELPGRDARIYVCLNEDRITAYYHVLVYEGVVGGEKRKFAMVQDVAVSAELRGQGVFRRLAQFADDDLVNSDVNLIYMFPNRKSIRTYLKYIGCEQIYTFDSYILPVDTATAIKSKIRLPGAGKLIGLVVDKYFDLRSVRMPANFKVNRQDYVDEETARFFQRFNERFLCHLNRTKDYLQWRFFEKPEGKHTLITLRDESRTLAAAVIKLDEILGARTAVVLDFAFEDDKHLLRLLHYVRRNAVALFDEKIGAIFISCCCAKLFADAKHGFIKIPLRFNPRPLHLLVKNISEDERVFDRRNWIVALGDWDVL